MTKRKTITFDVTTHFEHETDKTTVKLVQRPGTLNGEGYVMLASTVEKLLKCSHRTLRNALGHDFLLTSGDKGHSCLTYADVITLQLSQSLLGERRQRLYSLIAAWARVLSSPRPVLVSPHSVLVAELPKPAAQDSVAPVYGGVRKSKPKFEMVAATSPDTTRTLDAVEKLLSVIEENWKLLLTTMTRIEKSVDKKHDKLTKELIESVNKTITASKGRSASVALSLAKTANNEELDFAKG